MINPTIRKIIKAGKIKNKIQIFYKNCNKTVNLPFVTVEHGSSLHIAAFVSVSHTVRIFSQDMLGTKAKPSKFTIAMRELKSRLVHPITRPVESNVNYFYPIRKKATKQTSCLKLEATQKVVEPENLFLFLWL